MPKTEMTALDLAAAVREMELAGARVDRAYQTGIEEILLRVRRLASEGGRAEIAVGPGRYAFLTRIPRTNPLEPPSFAISLRKHLANGFVRSIRQHAFDRIVVVDVEKKDARYQLIAELFHDGNVVLVREGRIVAALTTQTFKDRTVRAGSPYEFPPERLDPRALTREAFDTRLIASPVDLVRALAVELNLGGVLAEEVVARAGLAKNAPAAGLDEDARGRVYAALVAILTRVASGDLDPVVVRDGANAIDVAPFPLAAHEGYELERHATFSQALDAYFSKPAPDVVHDKRAEKVTEERDRLARQLAQQQAAVEKFRAEEIAAKKRGDVLYAHFVDVEDLLRYLRQATRDIGWAATREQLAKHPQGKLVSKLHEHEGAADLQLPDETGKGTRVRVDIRKSIQENAQDWYARGKKMREKQVGAAKAMEETRARAAAAARHTETLLRDLAEEKTRAKPTKRFWFESFRWFETSDGHLVIGGRDAASNEKAVKKHLAENDRYMHADLHGAPSLVVLNRGGTPPSEAALAEAAQYAVAMSKAWATGHASGDAYWVLPSQVTKTPQSGEFLARGAFVIRGKRNYVSVTVRLALGEVTLLGERKVMCGPESAIIRRSERYVLLEPGDEEKNVFAKRAARALNVPIEEILSILPAGGVSVAGVTGLEI